MLIITGCQQRDRALVIRGGTRSVNLFMELRNRGENEREEDRTDASRRHQGAERNRFASSQLQAHVRGSLRPPGARRKDVLRGAPLLPLLDRGSGAVYQWLMIGPAKIYFIIFGLLTIVGGVIGYVKAGSTASIVAGAISGIALIVAAYLLPGNVALGLIIAGVVSIALAGRFIPAFMKTGKVMPAGLMAILSVIGVIVAIVAWIKK